MYFGKQLVTVFFFLNNIAEAGNCQTETAALCEFRSSYFALSLFLAVTGGDSSRHTNSD